MKTYVLSLFVLLFVHSSIAEDDSSSSEEILEGVKNKRVRSFLKNSGAADNADDYIKKYCPGSEDKLKKSLVQFQKCADDIDDSLTICESAQVYTQNCTTPVIKVLSSCLPEHSNGLPNLVLKSGVSILDFICKQTGETVLELFNPCIYEDVNDTNEVQCEEKFKKFMSEHEESAPSSLEICKLAEDARTCLQTHVNHNCKNPKTRNAAVGFYDALIRPCSSLNNVSE